MIRVVSTVLLWAAWKVAITAGTMAAMMVRLTVAMTVFSLAASMADMMAAGLDVKMAAVMVAG